MGSLMTPERWQGYLAAFCEFQSQSGSKYRTLPKSAAESAPLAESPSVKATPVKSAPCDRPASFDVSMGTASTVLTSPNSGILATNTAETAPSTISSKISKNDPLEMNRHGVAEQQVNETLIGTEEVIHKASTLKSLPSLSSAMPGDSNPRELMVGSTPGPSLSVNFSNSTMQPTTPDQLESEISPSELGEQIQSNFETMTSQHPFPAGTDSNTSDEVVFRQEENNGADPRLQRRKQFAEPDAMSIAVKVNAPEGRAALLRHKIQRRDEHAAQLGQVDPPIPRSATKKNAFLKERTLEEKRAELRRLQEEIMTKLNRKRLGLDESQDHTGPLHLAREGPGTDPTSEIARGIRKLVSGIPENFTFALPAAETANSQHCKSTSMEVVVANSSVVVPGKHPEASVELHDDKFQPVLVDWHYRPWEVCNKEWTKRFGEWLEYTTKLDCSVDIHSGPFTNSNFHPDGIAGFFNPDFEEPVAILDESIPENAHAYETAAGYVYNWNLRLEHEKAKQLQEKQRAITHTKAIAKMKPEPHPYAPKTNVYLRPVEPKDIRGLTALYNWYVKNSVRCIELDEISQEEMKLRVDENEAARLPCLVAAEHKPGRGHAMNSEDEMIYGFIMANEFSGPRTANRYAAELELFVNPTKYNRRVGRSLLDKMLEICDPQYTPKRGYTFDCAGPKRGLYCGADVRSLSRLMFIVHHSVDDVDEYQWFKGWMEEEFNFIEQGLLQGTAVKQQKFYLVRSTPLRPETKGDMQVVRWQFGKTAFNNLISAKATK
ncbi:hypothetical protein PRK78_000264 [Emydomyces testavorans]|uniref:N-acetyltransferase domain-containing protein n=1 Tax=Emydomyces testavorans TaxID=2070801 RepID=A0AAF0IFS5_9EURO|nr:hypothetical protein PRK78_000264 [Emydomyces testavorans]